MFKVGCHLSSAGGYLAMGQTACAIGANVFQFFTRNPRGGVAKPVEKDDVKNFLAYAKEHQFGQILAHASYTLNAAAAEARIRDFAHMVMLDDLRRLEETPGAYYNFHPGSHVGQGSDVGISLVAKHLGSVLNEFGNVPSTTILFETMAGKGSELGRSFQEIRTLIDQSEAEIAAKTGKPVCNAQGEPLLGVCLDTCHIWDGGYDIVQDLDGVLAAFDREIGLARLKAIHLNDSLNACAARKDRHAKLGAGKIGLEALERIINHPKLAFLPFYLETPNDLDGYRMEITLLKTLRQKDDA